MRTGYPGASRLALRESCSVQPHVFPAIYFLLDMYSPPRNCACIGSQSSQSVAFGSSTGIRVCTSALTQLETSFDTALKHAPDTERKHLTRRAAALTHRPPRDETVLAVSSTLRHTASTSARLTRCRSTRRRDTRGAPSSSDEAVFSSG